MKLQDKIKKNIQTKGLYNIRHIEDGAGLRRLKLYEFLNGTAKLSDKEATSVLTFMRNATKLQR